jgi:hypothetical protein
MTDTTQLIKERTMKNLYYFYTAFVASTFENYQEAEHIQKLSRYLERLTYDNNFPDRLCVAMPPQHSKSSIVTLAYSCWLICRNPNRRILIVNAEKELSTSFGIDIRKLFYNIAPYFDLQISNVKSSSTHLKFEKNGQLCNGEIRLTGATGSITGHPADIIIVDDPYKGLEDEFTPTQLRKKWNWFSSLIEQRLRTSSKLVLLHTRWHSEDIQGQLLADEYQRSKYYFVEFPAIDENNQPLWHEYYDIDFYLDKQRTMGERQFQAIYQQKPLDLTSDFFHINHLIFEDHFDDYIIAKCRSWDIASSDDTLGDQRDYTAGVRMVKTPGDQYWIFDYTHGQYGNNVKNVIKNTARLDGPDYTILLEPGTKGGASKLLYEEYKSALTGYSTIQSEPRGTKADRATPLANAIYDGKVHVCINNNELRELFLSQLQSFPNGKHDDIVDACSYGYLFLQGENNNIIGTGGKRRRRSL